MPSRHWQRHVDDMLSAIAEIQEFAHNMTFGEFKNDRKTLRATLYNFAILGEAVRGIPHEVEAKHPDISWIDLRGMRNMRNEEYCDS